MFFNGMLFGSASPASALATSFREADQLDPPENVPSSFADRGTCLSGDGNTAILTASQYQNGTNNVGAAFVYVKANGTWTFQQRIDAQVTNYGGQFATSAALSNDGNTAVLGTNVDTADGYGAAYVFTRSGSTWSLQQKLPVPDQTGTAYAIEAALGMSGDGNTIVVGAPHYDGATTDSGAVFFYTRSGATWTQQSTILQDPPDAETLVGLAVALSRDGTTLAASSDSGFFIFTRSGNTWSQQQYVSSGSPLWIAISKDGRQIALGFPITNKVVIYSESGGTWTASTTINGETSADRFGEHVALSDDGRTLAASAPWHATPYYRNGKLYTYKRSNLTWSLDQGFQAQGVVAQSFLGAGGIAISGDGFTLLSTSSESDGFGITWEAAAPIVSGNFAPSLMENSGTAVTTYTATGVEPITWSISGTDAAQFTINSSTGALAFASAPDYEAPTDAGSNNVYDLTVTATNDYGSHSRDVAVTVTNDTSDDVPPTITSGPAIITHVENISTSSVIGTYVASGGSITWSLQNYSDNSTQSIGDYLFFEINSSGQLKWSSSPDYENPDDYNSDNTYFLKVRATNANGYDEQLVIVNVTNDTSDDPIIVNVGGTDYDLRSADVILGNGNDYAGTRTGSFIDMTVPVATTVRIDMWGGGGGKGDTGDGGAGGYMRGNITLQPGNTYKLMVGGGGSSVSGSGSNDGGYGGGGSGGPISGESGGSAGAAFGNGGSGSSGDIDQGGGGGGASGLFLTNTSTKLMIAGGGGGGAGGADGYTGGYTYGGPNATKGGDQAGGGVVSPLTFGTTNGGSGYGGAGGGGGAIGYSGPGGGGGYYGGAGNNAGLAGNGGSSYYNASYMSSVTAASQQGDTRIPFTTGAVNYASPVGRGGSADGYGGRISIRKV